MRVQIRNAATWLGSTSTFSSIPKTLQTRIGAWSNGRVLPTCSNKEPACGWAREESPCTYIAGNLRVFAREFTKMWRSLGFPAHPPQNLETLQQGAPRLYGPDREPAASIRSLGGSTDRRIIRRLPKAANPFTNPSCPVIGMVARHSGAAESGMIVNCHVVEIFGWLPSLVARLQSRGILGA